MAIGLVAMRGRLLYVRPIRVVSYICMAGSIFWWSGKGDVIYDSHSVDIFPGKGRLNKKKITPGKKRKNRERGGGDEGSTDNGSNVEVPLENGQTPI